MVGMFQVFPLKIVEPRVFFGAPNQDGVFLFWEFLNHQEYQLFLKAIEINLAKFRNHLQR